MLNIVSYRFGDGIMKTCTKKLLAALAMGSIMLGASAIASADTTEDQESFSEYSNTSPVGDFDHDGDSHDWRGGPDVPESQTWAMIGIGVGLVAFQLRRRSKRFHKSDLS
jgi:hypothetical protein